MSRISVVAALAVVAELALSPAQADAAQEKVQSSRPKPSAAECALLDDPSIAGRMDGLLRHLAIGCGRQAEFIGNVREEGGPEGLNFAPAAVDAPVSSPAQDTSGTAKTESETSIAYNPVTGTLCAAWNDSFHGITQNVGFSGFGRSTDNGATWVDKGAVNPTADFDDGDPSLVWRKLDGKFYYAALKGGGLGVYRSDDDCNTFTFVSQISTGGDDKEIMAVDNNPASPFYGRLYVTWTDFGIDDRIYATTSSNAGATWAPQLALSTSTIVQGSWPVVAPNGDVFAAWVSWIGDFGTGNIDIQVARSTNGGTTWSLVTQPMSNQVNPREAAAQAFCNRPALKGNIRHLPSPTIAVDAAGVLHAVYTYDPDATGVGDTANVYYRRSTDNGATWQPEIKVNDDATITDQYQPSLSVGEGNVVAVGYYSRQNDVANNLLIDYYSRVSYNGGVSWQPSTRLSDVSTSVVLDPNLADCYHGDYDTQLHRPGAAQYLWSDDRNPGTGADPNIYTESTPAGVDFLVLSAASTQSICPPANAVYPIDVFQFQGFAETVNLSATGNPGATSAVFAPTGVIPPGASTLTIGNTTGLPFGTSTITITGTSTPSTIVHSSTVSLTVYPTAPAAPVLVAPADASIDQVRSPTLDWNDVPEVTGYHVDVATDAAFTNIVRTADVATSQWDVTPALGILTQYFWRVRADNPCGPTLSAAPFSFTTANPTILLVDDDDDGPDVFATYQTLLNSLAVFDVWDVVDEGGEPTLADLTPYQAVIWFSGDRFGGNTTPSAGPQTPAETALGSYLDLGQKCFLIASQDYLWDMGGAGHNVATPFMTNYLGLASGTSDTGDYTIVDGLNRYGTLQNQSLTYPFTDFSDILVPAAATGVEIAFRGDTPNTNIGAISKRGTGFFTTYMSFGIEALPAASQDDLLLKFLSYCSSLLVDGFEAGNTSAWSSTVP